jgi:riboflavin synthase
MAAILAHRRATPRTVHYTARMFTGIVQAMGAITAVERRPFGVRLVVDRSDWTPPGGYRPAHGDSICVSGVCLTVVEAGDATLAFDVIVETLAKTTLGDLKPGDRVNLEPPVTPNQPLGGHFMQGHVDGVGCIDAVATEGGEWRVTVRPPAELMTCIVPKGSVAIDGVSLTIASVGRETFDVALIPTTLQLTTLGRAAVGASVNIEADMLAKTVVQVVRRMIDRSSNEGVTMATLREAGFAP